MKRLTLLAAGAACAAFPAIAAHPVINEVMQSNVHSLMIDNDFPDSWVELYNPGDTPIDLSGYRLGVKEKLSKCDDIAPAGILPPKGHVLLYCDKTGKGTHLSFRIDAGKGDVYLYAPDGDMADHVELAKMPAPDVAFGRTADGAEEWAYFIAATPGEANRGETAKKRTPDPLFSRKGGILDATETVTVSIPDEAPEGTRLLLTLDGREPGEADAVEAPHQLTISGPTPVRARLLAPGMLPAPSVAQTFIITDYKLSLPVVCITTDPDYLYSEEHGIMHGDISDPDANFRKKWRRPVIIEAYYDDDHTQVINQLGETALMGGTSREHAQKSLKLYANKRFGEKRFAHTLWPEDKPRVDEVKSFCIRNAGNTFKTNHIADAFFNRLFGRATKSVDYQAYQPVEVFINGKPYGLIDLRERSDEDHIEANYDGLEDIAMVENWSEMKTDESGPMFKALRKLYTSPDATWEQLRETIDMESLVTLLIADAFSFNVDTPAVNKIMWTPLEQTKWRWFLKDMDCTGYNHLADNDYIDYLNGVMTDDYEDWFKNQPIGTELFIKCLSFPEFTAMLIDRYVAYYGDILNPWRTTALLTDMEQETAEAFSRLAALYGFDDTRHQRVENLKLFCRERGSQMFANLQHRYGLGDTVDFDIENPDRHITVNGHKLSHRHFRGKAFAGRSVKLSSYDHGQWSIYSLDPDTGARQLIAQSQTRDFDYTPDGSASHIVAEFEIGSGIGDIITDNDASESVSWHTLQGITLPGEPSEPGIYIRRQGTRAEKVVVR